MSQQELLNRAMKIALEQDYDAAQKFITETFGDGSDLDIVKCDECGEILALVVNLLARSLSGGDRSVTLAVYKHIRAYPLHEKKINGHSHGAALPLGITLGAGLRRTAERFNLSFTEALDKRIAYLEEKLLETT